VLYQELNGVGLTIGKLEAELAVPEAFCFASLKLYQDAVSRDYVVIDGHVRIKLVSNGQKTRSVR
jgi:hypothetical protein